MAKYHKKCKKALEKHKSSKNGLKTAKKYKKTKWLQTDWQTDRQTDWPTDRPTDAVKLRHLKIFLPFSCSLMGLRVDDLIHRPQGVTPLRRRSSWRTENSVRSKFRVISSRRLPSCSRYSSSRLILENLKEPDTHIFSRKNAFGFRLLSTHSALKQSFRFLQQK